MSKAPYVSIENAEAVIEYFSHTEPSVPLMRVGHFVMGHAVRGLAFYEDGAKEAIDEHLKAGGQLLIPHNHQDAMDPMELASLFHREKILRPLITRTAIPAKHRYFNTWYGPILRRTGAIPVFRRRDFENENNNGSRRSANDALIEIFQARLNNGYHVAIYPEETRGLNEGQDRDPRELNDIRIGIGLIACGAEHPENIAVVAMGTVYGEDNHRRLHPVTFIKNPFGVAETPEEVRAATRESLQDAVDRAADAAGYSLNRLYIPQHTEA